MTTHKNAKSKTNSISKKIAKIINKIQNKPENEKIRIMWILVIFCMLLMIGIWKINFDLNKPTEINSDSSDNLDLPAFPKLEELNREIKNIEELNEEELLEENELKKELEK